MRVLTLPAVAAFVCAWHIASQDVDSTVMLQHPKRSVGVGTEVPLVDKAAANASSDEPVVALSRNEVLPTGDVTASAGTQALHRRKSIAWLALSILAVGALACLATLACCCHSSEAEVHFATPSRILEGESLSGRGGSGNSSVSWKRSQRSHMHGAEAEDHECQLLATSVVAQVLCEVAKQQRLTNWWDGAALSDVSEDSCSATALQQQSPQPSPRPSSQPAPRPRGRR